MSKKSIMNIPVAEYPNLKPRYLGSCPSNDGEEFYLLASNELSNIYSQLEGKILTIVESAITNEKQLEAIKSLIRNQIWYSNSQIWCVPLTREQVSKI